LRRWSGPKTDGADYIFGLPGNAPLDAMVAETADSMRQEVDIRYVVTSLKGSAQHLYENVYCHRGQMENLIKLHKAQLASDRMSCHSATANQVRLVLHTAAFWLMHGVRAAIPQTDPLARAEFTIRDRLIKIGARVIASISRASASSCRRVARRGRCSEPSLSASCRPAHEPRGRAPTSRREGRSIPNALHGEAPHTHPNGRIAGARPSARRAKKPRGVHDPG
jgi:hypothetical protein